MHSGMGAKRPRVEHWEPKTSPFGAAHFSGNPDCHLDRRGRLALELKSGRYQPYGDYLFLSFATSSRASFGQIVE
jgi:hypothetical protein